jgi:hypothetical protein
MISEIGVLLIDFQESKKNKTTRSEGEKRKMREQTSFLHCELEFDVEGEYLRLNSVD